MTFLRKTLTKGLKTLLIWRIKHISQKQFIIIVSALIGILSGLFAALIKNFSYLIHKFLEFLLYTFDFLQYFVFPIIGIIITQLIIKYFLRQSVGHGIPGILRFFLKSKENIKFSQMFSFLFTAPITIGFGGSVGLEGPAVSGGSTIAASISRLLHLNHASRNLMIGCAAAAVISAIFKAPITGIIFSIEVFMLDFTLASFLPLLISSVSALLTSYFFFGTDLLIPFKLKEPFQLQAISFYILLGVFSGFMSLFFTKIQLFIEKWFELNLTLPMRIVIGGLFLGCLVFFIPPLYGEGLNIINHLLREEYTSILSNNFTIFNLKSHQLILLFVFGLAFFKVFATSLTFGAGGKGGIFSPSLFIGSALGNSFALLINKLKIVDFQVSVSNFTLVGMAGLIAGVIHAPLTAIFLIAELSGGYALFVPLMITASISFSISKYFFKSNIYTAELESKGELISHDKDDTTMLIMSVNRLIETDFAILHPKMTLGEMLNEAVSKSKRNLYPVLNKKRELLGIILLDDIRDIMFKTEFYDTVHIKSIMHAPPDAIKLEKDTMKIVMKKFNHTGSWNLPVLHNGIFQGFISKSKMLSEYRKVLRQISKPIL